MPRLGTSGEPIFQVHENTSLLIPESASPVTVLLLVSFPSIAADGMGMAITVNEDAIAMSQMLARSDLYSGLFHNFYEVVELEPGDTVSVSLYWIDRSSSKAYLQLMVISTMAAAPEASLPFGFFEARYWQGKVW